jgi:predicted RNase H-like HicB family nuclease
MMLRFDDKTTLWYSHGENNESDLGEVENMRHTIKAFIHRGEKYYVAECLEIAVVTQGKTLDETISNLQEAVKLHLEGEDLTDFDLAPNPSLLVNCN